MTNELLAAVIIKGMWPYGESVSPHYKDTAYDCTLAALKEKEQQMIEKAVKWLEEHTTEYASFDDDRKADWENKMNFIEDFKQAMEADE